MDDDTDAPGDALIERLRVIESQPIVARPAAYALLHDELARALEAPPALPVGDAR